MTGRGELATSCYGVSGNELFEEGTFRQQRKWEFTGSWMSINTGNYGGCGTGRMLNMGSLT